MKRVVCAAILRIHCSNFGIDHSAYNPAIMIYLAAVHYILYPGNPNALRQVVEAVKRVM